MRWLIGLWCLPADNSCPAVLALDALFTGFTSFKAEEESEKLMTLLAELKPGVTEILIHAFLPTEGFPLISGSSEARRAELKTLTYPRVKKMIQGLGLILTT